ncbi:MAG: efflux RND transporter permease subunit [Pseudomonadota bacterium]
MNIVRLALHRPYTFLVLGITILLLGVSAILRTPTDIFPNVNIPVVTVVWYYDGLNNNETEKRITTYSEFSISFFVNDIRTIESQTIPGLVVEKIYFQPDVNVDLAMSQVVSATNSIRAFLPPGAQPPIIMQYSASTVPVLQLALSSDRLSESELYDYGVYRIRQQLAPIPGTMLPPPYGGRIRQVMVDIDPAALAAKGITPLDVSNAINAQNLSLPMGDVKFGDKDYDVRINSLADAVSILDDVPIKKVNGALIRIKDVAQVRDGYAIQQNIVRSEGRRSVLLSILKSGNASTLDVVDRVKNDVLPVSRAAAPPGMKIEELFDQSVFVRSAISGVAVEATIAALLTSAMILLFLSSWRSTLIVAVSIPLSILSSIAILSAIGETLNIMTLGGLALAVGILVDDATVTIENIHRLRQLGEKLPEATLHGAAGIALPTLVSTLAISAVFVSVEFLVGPSKFLFTPMALAVVFAMLASYVLSRTLVPILAGLLLSGEHHGETDANDARRPSIFARFSRGFEAGFERLRDGYSVTLERLIESNWKVPAAALTVLAVGIVLFLLVGRDFFPSIDAGEFKLHVRAPSGTRIETTEHIFEDVENTIRRVIPDSGRDLIIDDIGVPFRYALPFDDGTTVAGNDGQILVSLKPGHRPTAAYIKRLRDVLAQEFPDVTFYFQPGDIVTQILNFGLPAPIDVRVVGYDKDNNLRIVKAMLDEVKHVVGVADAHLHQIVDAPELTVAIDRQRAQDLGLDMQSVAQNVMVALASSNTVTPNFWVDPNTGIQYPVAVQVPQYKLASLSDVAGTLVGTRGASTAGSIPTLLNNVAGFGRDAAQTVTSHSNIQPTFDIYANVEGRDLGRISTDIDRIVAKYSAQLHPGNEIVVEGQIDSMRSAFIHMGIGLLVAAVVVYLLMAVNFQSFVDPFVVVLGLPGAMVGILFMLFATGTSLSVPSLMGAIMSVGVASANSILLVTFAKEQRGFGLSARDAAVMAGRTRLRPIIMTALAMIVGMIPMALGLGDGGEQNAPLGRAVIGGLMFGTVATLFLVPWLYSRLRKREGRLLEDFANV